MFRLAAIVCSVPEFRGRQRASIGDVNENLDGRGFAQNAACGEVDEIGFDCGISQRAKTNPDCCSLPSWTSRRDYRDLAYETITQRRTFLRLR